jgi:hypothetical protein
MANKYKIIPVDAIRQYLSQDGLDLLESARYSLDKTKVIRCLNHSQERIKSIFKTDFDIESFMLSTKTYTHEEALEEMKKPEWSLPLSGDL